MSIQPETRALIQRRKNMLAYSQYKLEQTVDPDIASLDQKGCIHLVNQRPLALRHLSLEQRTLPVCLAALAKDKRVIEYVPSEYFTEELLLDVVRYDGLLLRHIPRAMRTNQLYLEAAKRSPRLHMVLTPAEQTPEIKLLIARGYGLCLEDLTAPLTREVSLRLKKAAGAIAYLNPDQTTQDMLLRLVRIYPETIVYLVAEQKTALVLQTAILTKGTLIEVLTQAERTEDLILLASTSMSTKKYRTYIPEFPELRLKLGRNEGFRNAMVEKCGHLIKLVPIRLYNTRLCSLAINSVHVDDREELKSVLAPYLRFSNTKRAN